MMKALLLTTIGVIYFFAFAAAQNVFNPNDKNRRWVNNGTVYSNDSNALSANPNPGILGLQKWVSVKTSGVDSASWGKDYKAYFMNNNGWGISFRLMYPKSFNNPDSAGKKYPVMLFFHGAGEPGCPTNGGIYNNEKQMVHGGQTFRDRVATNQFDGFLLYPQVNMSSTTCWSDWGLAPYTPNYPAVIAILDSLAKYARLDVDRVLLTGLSNGGSAVWTMTTVYPQRVTKCVPSAAATSVNNYTDFIHVPMWFATGGKDTNPTPGFAVTAYNNIKASGADIRYTLYPDLGHFVWTTHWAEPDFVPYMNDLHKANPLVYFQRYDFCPDSAIDTRIGITAGFYAYEWQKDGLTIATSTNGVNTIVNGASLISYNGNEIQVRSFGTYRVRFKRLATSDWSAWSMKPAVIYPKAQTITPPIAVVGMRTKVLPGVDGSNMVPLMIPLGYSGYQWVRIFDNAVVSTTNTYNAPIGQYKAKIIEQFGCGSAFSPIFTVVDGNGSPKPDAAKNLSANVASISTIQLDWNENPNPGQNETGFEIYRSNFAGGPYQLLAITAPNIVTFLDQGLATNTKYFYVVRSVGDFGAAATSNEASAVTGEDKTAPSAPSALTVVCASKTNVALKWTAATDNQAVTAYDIYINGVKSYTTTTTRFSINDLTTLQTFAFAVKARDASGNVSPFSNQVVANTNAQGLCYKYYLNPAGLAELPDYNSATPVVEGIAPNVAFTAGGSGQDNFGYLWEGYINITTVGNYRFQTCSDDGSRLYLKMPYNASVTPTINNDGLHGTTCVNSATINFPVAGQFPIAATFFENGGGEAMTLNWAFSTSGTPSTYTAIPNVNFTEAYTPSGTIPAIPTGLTATATGSGRITVSWTDASNNETGFEVVRSTTSNGTYVPVATVAAGVTSFIDSSLNYSTPYFFKVRSIGAIGQSAFTASATATTQAGPAAPAAPSSLVTTVIAKDIIKLDWNDNSANETGFEIWRSVGNATTYRLFKTINGGSGATKTFSDSSLFANVTYYYKIKSVGAGGASAFSNQASATTLNTRPDLTHILDFTMKYNTSYGMPINAVDADGDILTFTFGDLPSFASLQAVNNGNAYVVMNPTVGDQGAYSITAYVDDGHNGRDTATFVMIVNDNTVPVVDTITDKVLDEGKILVVPVKANDAEGNAYMVWTFENLPSFATFKDSGNGKGSITLKPGYATSGLYTISVFADDGNGAWAKRTFKLLVNDFDPNDNIKVNMRAYTASNLPDWNEVDIPGLPVPFNKPALKNSKGIVTTVGINIVSSGSYWYSSGVQTGNNTGIYPDIVMKDGLDWGRYNFGTADTLRMRIYGLDTARRYNIVFFASSTDNSFGVNNNSVTTYRIGNDMAQVHYYLNSTETDTIYQVKPNAAGEALVTMIGDAQTQAGGLLNALVINAAYDDGTAPAKPLDLQGDFIENNGVRLTWIDRAYNEFSYNIYRSTSKTGPYTLLNPLGQNSDSTGYTDLSAQQYTTYYYYVAGVNNYGAGSSSDTVVIITGNNKPVISGVENFVVKTDNSYQEFFNVSDLVTDDVQVTIDNIPSFVVLDNMGGGNYRITATPTIDNLGQDFLIITARDNKGGVTTKELIITVTDKNLTRTVFVNFGQQSMTAPSPWNNFLHYGNVGSTINNLKDETGSPTTIGMQLVEGWSSMFLTGHITGNNSGVATDSVLRSGIYYNGTATRNITISGLDPARRYNIVVIGSQNEGYDARMRMVSSVGQVDTLDARNNTNMTGNLNGLVPPGNGIITLTMNKLNAASTSSMFLNGIILEEFNPATVTIMNPVNLTVEPKDTSTVIVTWSDRSNNENGAADGFQLQRATDSLFTSPTSFNIWGNNSTFTNTGLVPNTKYWYRIRAKTGSTFSSFSNQVKTITPQSMILVNFNQNVQSASSPWNNLADFPDINVVFNNLQKSTTINSGISLRISRAFNGENNAGSITGNNTGMGGLVPDIVLQSGYWMDNIQQSQMILSGLNQTKRYRIGYISSSNWLGGELTSTLTINGRTVYINGWQNTSKIVYIGDLVPDQNGQLILNFSTSPTSANGYSSGLIIEPYNDVNGGAVLNSAVQNPLVKNVVQETPPSANILNEHPDVTAVVYPNPFVDDITIDFKNAVTGRQAQVELYDISGRKLMSKTFSGLQEGFQTLRLSTIDSKLAPGVYMVTLAIDGRLSAINKLVKIKK